MSRDEPGSESRDLALTEAALFLSPQPMTRRGLSSILGGVQLSYVDQLLDELGEALEQSARGIELHVEDGRAMLRVRGDLVEAVAHLAPQQDIRRPILRTLAVIAYNHPITQANLVRVRGNKAYGHVQELLERRLIRAEEHGRTYLLHTTKEFLRHFGLKTIDEFRFYVGGSSKELEIDALDDDAPQETPQEGGNAAPVGSPSPDPLSDGSHEASAPDTDDSNAAPSVVAGEGGLEDDASDEIRHDDTVPDDGAIDEPGDDDGADEDEHTENEPKTPNT